MDTVAPKLSVEGVYKIFGPDPDAAIAALERGASKAEVQRETGCVVGVSDATFDVAAGEIFVVMGLSGSGKSTLIRCLNRLIAPTRGAVRVDGEDIVAADAERLRRLRLERMAMVFQHFALFPHMSVGENAAYGLKVRGVDAGARRAKALEALDLVGLGEWADAPPSSLSGGMQQRVGLARALAVGPEILLMDEPFSALDPLIRRDMQLELLAIQQRFGNSIVFITHDLHEALVLGDRVAIMKDGRFVQVGTPEAIVAAPADDYVAEFTRDVDRGRVLRAEGVARPAATIGRGDATPAAALERMARDGVDAVHLTDADGRAVGVITRADAEHARAEGRGDLDGAMRTQFPTARPTDRLVEIYPACRAELPIAVVDDSGRLDGVLDPGAALRALVPPQPEGGDAHGERAA